MDEQRKILIGMAGGAFASIALLIVGPLFNLLPPASPGNHSAIAASLALILIWLVIGIARLARLRFFAADDRNPMVAEGSKQARSLQNQLQNTLEQVVLALGAYGVWWLTAPSHWGALPVYASILFSIGRLLFFAGYDKGAAARSFGFALTFYPTLAIFGAAIIGILVGT